MITFGICTGGLQEDRINRLIDSIERQSIDQYEILVVGNFRGMRKACRVIPFDETIRPMWITRKKNIIAQSAQYEKIAFLHDYMVLEDGWWEAWSRYGDGWQIACNKLVLKNGERYVDCTLSPWCRQVQIIKESLGLTFEENLIPYGEVLAPSLMYMSGAFFLVKRNVMLDIPMDERLKWGDGEDVEWSHRIRKKHSFSFNSDALCRCMRDGKVNPWKDIPIQKYRELIGMIDIDNSEDDCRW